jgi:hypothetical protein
MAKATLGDSRNPNAILVRNGKYSCIVMAVHNTLNKTFRVKSVYPGLNGEVPVWLDLRGTVVNSKREIREMFNERLADVRQSLEDGNNPLDFQVISMVVPRRDKLAVKEYAANLVTEYKMEIIEKESTTLATFIKGIRVNDRYNQIGSISAKEEDEYWTFTTIQYDDLDPGLATILKWTVGTESIIAMAGSLLKTTVDWEFLQNEEEEIV